jgi:hypothetical protein
MIAIMRDSSLNVARFSNALESQAMIILTIEQLY